MKPRTLAWIVAFSFPLWFIPLWVGCWKLTGLNIIGVTTATGGLLLVMVSVAAYTDLQSARIPNWITYTGTLWALTLNAIHSWYADESTNQWMGTVGIAESLVGFFVLFFGLLVIFSFSGGGSGDVKLVGAVGAFLGLANGFEAILLAFIFCAVASLLLTIYRLVFRTAVFEAGSGKTPSFGLTERVQATTAAARSTWMKQKIRLAPSFAFGVFLILCRESGMLHFSLLGY
jgi:prepilin peptidase CpaA